MFNKHQVILGAAAFVLLLTAQQPTALAAPPTSTLDVAAKKVTGLMPFVTKDGSPAWVQIEVFAGVKGDAARKAIQKRLEALTPVEASAPPLDPKGRVLPNGDWVGEQALKVAGIRIPVTKVHKHNTTLALEAYAAPLGWAGVAADPSLKVRFEDRVMLVKHARRDPRLAAALESLPADAVVAVRIATNNPLMGLSHLSDSFLNVKKLEVPTASLAPHVRGPSKKPPKIELRTVVKGMLRAPGRLPRATLETAVSEGGKVAAHGFNAMGHMMSLRPDKAMKEAAKGGVRFMAAPFRAFSKAAFGSHTRARPRRRGR